MLMKLQGEQKKGDDDVVSCGSVEPPFVVLPRTYPCVHKAIMFIQAHLEWLEGQHQKKRGPEEEAEEREKKKETKKQKQQKVSFVVFFRSLSFPFTLSFSLSLSPPLSTSSIFFFVATSLLPRSLSVL
jgi:hypothetical protein